MQNNVDEAIIGGSRSGKTFGALKRARVFPGPVLFFNPQEEKAPGFVRADKKVPLSLFRQALKENKKVNYIPDADRKYALQELDWLVQSVLRPLGKHCILIADECDDYARQGQRESPLFWVAQRGNRYGVTGWYITQDPARADKILFKNCPVMRVHLFNDFGAKYLSNYGYDVEKLKAMIKKKGQWSYVLIENGEVKGVYKD